MSRRASLPRNVPLAYVDLRQDDEDEDMVECPNCDGTGTTSDGTPCAACAGTGEIPESQIGDDDGMRRQFSAADRKRLAAKGWALPDGSYPVESATDLSNAIKAYGRNPTERVRSHLIRQARRLGKVSMLPKSWGVRRSALLPNDSDDLRLAFQCARLGLSPRSKVALAPNDDLADARMQLQEVKDRIQEARQLDRLARQARGATERDRHEDTWLLRRITPRGLPGD